jgi:hypothetical protein
MTFVTSHLNSVTGVRDRVSGLRSYVKQDDIQTGSRYHCFRRKAIRITHSECESVAYVLQHKKHMRSIILSVGLPRSGTFFHII